MKQTQKLVSREEEKQRLMVALDSNKPELIALIHNLYHHFWISR